jgi:hypothetical protein
VSESERSEGALKQQLGASLEAASSSGPVEKELRRS